MQSVWDQQHIIRVPVIFIFFPNGNHWRHIQERQKHKYHRRVGDSYGQWMLDEEAWGSNNSLASSSMQRPFNNSVKVLHLTMDMCFFDNLNDGRKEKENYQSATMELAVKSSFHKVMLWPRARSMIPQVKKPIWSMQNESVHDNPHANYQCSFITNKYYDVSHTGDQKSSTWEIEIYTASSGCTTCNVCGCMYCCVLNAGVDVK